MARFTRPISRILGGLTRPIRYGYRRRFHVDRIQRSVRLHDEDRTDRRRRWHVLVDLIHEHCPKQDVVVAELGAREGVTSFHILKYCPQVRIIHAVDLQDCRHDFVRDRERIDFILGDSAGAAARFADESFDLVFVDADHSESAVRRDVSAWLPKLRPGGVIAGHDFGGDRHPGVERAVTDLFRGHAHGVKVDADKVWWTLR